MSQPEPAEDWLPTADSRRPAQSQRTHRQPLGERGHPPIAFQAPGATGARFFRAEDVRRLADDRIARFMPDLTAGSAS